MKTYRKRIFVISTIIMLIALFFVLFFNSFNEKIYTSKQVETYLKEKYNLSDITLLSENKLEIYNGRNSPNRYIYEYSANGVIFTTIADTNTDYSIFNKRWTRDNYYNKIVMNNQKIKDYLHQSTIQWEIEEESNDYILYLNIPTDLDIEKAVTIIHDLINLQEPIYYNGDKKILDNRPALRVVIADKKSHEKTVYFYFPYINENPETRDKIKQLIEKG